ncbi:hypothetical protein SARC_08342 [Sphaeroforma arctica JP610]|uniref:U4/U6.U5 tri-snRNP-associated protein 2 n=1 Tax=Sphaeroforma arctica JP610 TaxID=667725 RepID=A0A0L0FR20_9EUKA|nr:hypothetical protein SARC_08342 [Sphaeroforma arctica JP610]KNC79257.1 hypothetical protein SARC_08342 [Sphaeroforma arctica JP610]|eukprot:XP_014153159.1 hypothetical protein SARC_08342 [Sphaeroforma arctica JP610]
MSSSDLSDQMLIPATSSRHGLAKTQVDWTSHNVYACLVCGKYYQGRGSNTHAHTHSVTQNHHVFINLGTKKFYCLPDCYEIIDSSLQDILDLLDPLYTPQSINALNTITVKARARDGSRYLPGIIGLNNIKKNDYMNVVVQALTQITDLRDFFLSSENTKNLKEPLAVRTGELFRKVWSSHHYRPHVSPHELCQAIVNTSNKRFTITKQSFAVDFMAWYLNTLNTQLSKAKHKPSRSTIVSDCFQGIMEVTERRLRASELLNDEVLQERAALAEKDTKTDFSVKKRDMPFMFLTLDVPPAPLFTDAEGANVIPQIPLYTLFEKFNGTTEQSRDGKGFIYKIKQLPRYLIVYIKRFTKNNFFLEKNPTIVNFPVKNLDLKDFVGDKYTSETRYDLVANIVRDGPPDRGSYRVHVLHKGRGQGTDSWFQIEDLIISNILPQVITLSEAYLQIYQLRT